MRSMNTKTENEKKKLCILFEEKIYVPEKWD